MECNHLRFLDGWMPCCTKYVRLSTTLSCYRIQGLLRMLQLGSAPSKRRHAAIVSRCDIAY